MAMRCLPCWSSVLLSAGAALFAVILSSCSGAALGGKQGGTTSGGPPASKVTPTITWPTPSPINNPTPLSTTQLDATASVPGTFVYTPPAGTVLAAGTQTLSVAFTPTDTRAHSYH